MADLNALQMYAARQKKKSVDDQDGSTPAPADAASAPASKVNFFRTDTKTMTPAQKAQLVKLLKDRSTPQE